MKKSTIKISLCSSVCTGNLGTRPMVLLRTRFQIYYLVLKKKVLHAKKSPWIYHFARRLNHLFAVLLKKCTIEIRIITELIISEFAKESLP